MTAEAPPPGAPSKEGQPTCRVCLIDEVTIVARGERLRVWYVRQGDAWMKASEHPDQIPPEGDDSDATPPGVVWQRPVELRLPKGTRLLSRLTSPHVERLAPHEYLERGRLGVGRKVAEEEFVVVGNYRVQRSKQEP